MGNLSEFKECSGLLGCESVKCTNFDSKICGPVSFLTFLNIQAFVAVIVNAIHIIIVKRARNLCQSNLGTSVLCLAVLDILTSLTVILVSNCNVQSIMMKYQRLCSLSVLIAGLPQILSAYVLLLISLDRVRAVSKIDSPNNNDSCLKKRFKLWMALTIIVLLVIAGGSFVIDAVFTEGKPCHTGFTMCRIDHKFSATMGLSSVIIISIPVFIYLCNHGAMGIILTVKVMKAGPLLVGKKLKNSIISIALLCLTFLLSWIPIASLKLAEISQRHEVGAPLHFMGMLLLCSSAFVNPFVFCASNERYRRSIKTLFCRNREVGVI